MKVMKQTRQGIKIRSDPFGTQSRASAIGEEARFRLRTTSNLRERRLFVLLDPLGFTGRQSYFITCTSLRASQFEKMQLGTPQLSIFRYRRA